MVGTWYAFSRSQMDSKFISIISIWRKLAGLFFPVISVFVSTAKKFGILTFHNHDLLISNWDVKSLVYIPRVKYSASLCPSLTCSCALFYLCNKVVLSWSSTWALAPLLFYSVLFQILNSLKIFYFYGVRLFFLEMRSWRFTLTSETKSNSKSLRVDKWSHKFPVYRNTKFWF